MALIAYLCRPLMAQRTISDVDNGADFDVPYTQEVLERFMSNMSKLADDEYWSDILVQQINA